jgi:biopolymer transport protein ExbD
MNMGGRRQRRRGAVITLNLASMIDVVFLLLTYFLVTTTLTPPEDRLSTALQSSKPSTSQASDFRPQIVEVARAGGSPVYRLGANTFTDRESLRAALAPLPKDAGLFIKVHDGVPVGFAVVAVQTGKDVGFEKVTYVPAGSSQ